MSDIPSDLFTEILSRLPVQSLLRFRSTSKSLRSLIDSHNFTNLHLENSLNFNLILHHNSKLYQLDFPNLTTAVRIKHHLRGTVYLLGSCNGLLCISNGRDIAFVNPNTRSHHSIITNINRCVGGCGSAFYQFADNYKLLRINSCLVVHYPQPYTFVMVTKVRLFSFKTNSWNELPDIPYDILSHETVGVRVENSFHWVMTGNLGKHRILAFNITQEIFNEVPLPDLEEATSEIKYVSLLGKCLCITVSCNGTNKFDVWVMKEYGYRDSWCKLFTLGEWCFKSPLMSLMPLCYSSDRSKVLLEGEFRGDFVSDPKKKLRKKLFWYYLKSYKVTYVTGIPHCNEAMIYVGSLLPPSLPIDSIAS